MKTTKRSVATLSTSLKCAYDTAFEYLAEPFNQKDWAIHFFKNLEKIDGTVIATLPFGKLPLNIASDYHAGTLDIHLGDAKPTRTRLIEIEAGLIQYNFTLAQPEGMPSEVWEGVALPNMREELDLLKTILESK